MAPMTARIPEKATVDGLEDRWNEAWESQGTYRFDETKDREQIYSIDTPPPTVSGSLHVGHVFSYTHTDVIARYQRMCGREVFYPMGWDDNGLPTERRVQNYFGVRCDPTLPYEPGFEPPHVGGEGKSIKAADQQPVSRRNFVELCERLTEEDEKQFEALWRHLGLSVDWSRTYQTIEPDAQAVAQQAFLRSLARGEAYQAEAPTLWDVTFRTAVAQAELEDRERPGAYHRVAFEPAADTEEATGSYDSVWIETTRPELLPACVALVAHPDDERYQPLFGKHVRTPLFGVEVPVVAHRLASPEKGSGIAMICTFGDVTDVIWWRELDLPMRSVLGRDGRFAADAPAGVDSPAAVAAYAELAGKTVFSAQQRVVEMLREADVIDGDPRPVSHPVKFYEKGDKPLEIVTSRQWYIANGGRDAELRGLLLERGAELDFVPAHMGKRYENWVNGLTGDWLISRQRFFGVPIPVWYPLDEAGEPVWDQRIVPAEDTLPVDPSVDAAPGFTEDQRDQPGGFVGEMDIMDTWATSSLTPQIVGGWRTDPALFAKVFPMDLRPQGQDIIRTWLFSTVVRSHLEHGTLPWKHAAISGWILDPDRKKMSKSKGNVVTPMGLLETHGSDAVRYWAASARLGTDAAFDEGQMKVGRRLAMKVLNASKFVLGATGIATAADESLEEGLRATAHVTGGVLGGSESAHSLVTQPLDRALLAGLADVVDKAGAALEAYDHTRALELTESLFWTFCDDYVELVKTRAYDGAAPGEAIDPFAECSPEAASARAALTIALETFLRLFAPVLPFATEEVWSWFRPETVHRAPWPTSETLRAVAGDAPNATLVDAAGAALATLRKIKSEAKVSQRTELVSVDLLVPEAKVAAVFAAKADVMAAGRVRALQIVDAEAALDPGVDGEGPEDGSGASIADTSVMRTENVVFAD
ncbi:valine--tRNA ligase [Demequina sp. EGI L300058]|uniref:Valine--tRNA ligase n=2 Tax=Demequina muriae TaxID=3051664 RepID=A0ABT8GEA9_9MICO|nr:valine--tRNA ligase [Demequina sp. EGI L300058]MDN4479765.1 valine--tRNA ligase [Demequina sp. EGI L300058]